CNLCD
ncbi:hypothetical protein BV086_00714B, partial [Haemophilus influenzae]